MTRPTTIRLLPLVNQFLHSACRDLAASSAVEESGVLVDSTSQDGESEGDQAIRWRDVMAGESARNGDAFDNEDPDQCGQAWWKNPVEVQRCSPGIKVCFN
jgi:hypothetical protein